MAEAAYTPHRWMATDDGAVCLGCGISEADWEAGIENDSLLNWDCTAVRARTKAEQED